MDYIDTMVLSNNDFTNICNFLFPTNYLTTLAITTHNVQPLILAVLIVAALYALSVLVAFLTYRKGLFAAAVIGNKKASRKTLSANGGHKVFASLVIKEFKVLTRTMTYRMNCVYANLLWPIAAVIFIAEAPKFEFFKIFAYKLENGDPLNHVILFAVIIAMAFIASGLNSIASTSFTREGVHIDMLKYLPAPLDKQINAKILIAILFTFIPEVLAVAVIAVRFGIAYMLPLYILITFVCILIATIIGTLMDSISPYTVWSDELSALRGNLNCFFNLAAEMVFALLIGGISYGIYLLSANAIITIASVSALLAAAGIAGVMAGLPQVRKNIELLK